MDIKSFFKAIKRAAANDNHQNVYAQSSDYRWKIRKRIAIIECKSKV
ncbi:MAG: hypothetical protein LBI78_02170 [Campylobacteraceae bacterium]|jgi:hypothetical protein|nr:hypothetical protein [Campylobacteraceae bacterium]